jgi:hypothetical protein
VVKVFSLTNRTAIGYKAGNPALHYDLAAANKTNRKDKGEWGFDEE